MTRLFLFVGCACLVPGLAGPARAADQTFEFGAIADATAGWSAAYDRGIGGNGGLPNGDWSSIRTGRTAPASTPLGYGLTNSACFAQWDLTSLAGKTVLGVELRLYLTSSSTGDGLDVSPITAAWLESTYVPNAQVTMPGYVAPLASYAPGLLVGQYNVLTDPDLTALVTGWIDGTTPSYGLLFQKQGAYSGGENALFFSSREGNYAPLLVVTVAGPSPHMGDANGDRKVDLQDFTLLKAHYNQTGTPPWQFGNFNGDSRVDLQDFTLLKAHYNHTGDAGTTPVTGVPEPASAALAAAAMAGLLRRRLSPRARR